MFQAREYITHCPRSPHVFLYLALVCQLLVLDASAVPDKDHALSVRHALLPAFICRSRFPCSECSPPPFSSMLTMVVVVGTVVVVVVVVVGGANDVVEDPSVR